MLDYTFIREFIFFINNSHNSSGPTEKETLIFATRCGIGKHELGYVEVLLFEAAFITHKPSCIENRFVNLTPGVLTPAGKNALLLNQRLLEVD
ncbi:hypothetical protein [Liquorilactobacillus capillatus]|nr:hypothetical protein [Liquorilactobacillus capillatus]